jgi:hypothetical protein
MQAELSHADFKTMTGLGDRLAILLLEPSLWRLRSRMFRGTAFGCC